jgi:hypothetical protein
MLDGNKLKERLGAMQQGLNNIANGVSPRGGVKFVRVRPR